MIKRIYLDLDDTLNTFSLHVLRKLGCRLGAFEYEKYPHVGYNLDKAYSALSGESADGFWSKVRSDFALSAPLSPEADFIYKECLALVGAHNTYILTKPWTAESYGTKALWVKRNFPLLLENLIVCRDKTPFANRESLLIDDHEENVDAWRQAGGIGCLVPRPWNWMRDYDTSSVLSGVFEFLSANEEVYANC